MRSGLKQSKLQGQNFWFPSHLAKQDLQFFPWHGRFGFLSLFPPTLTRGAACCCFSVLSELQSGGERALMCPQPHWWPPSTKGLWKPSLCWDMALDTSNTPPTAMVPGSLMGTPYQHFSLRSVGRSFSVLFLELYIWQLMSLSNRISF